MTKAMKQRHATISSRWRQASNDRKQYWLSWWKLISSQSIISISIHSTTSVPYIYWSARRLMRISGPKRMAWAMSKPSIMPLLFKWSSRLIGNATNEAMRHFLRIKEVMGDQLSLLLPLSPSLAGVAYLKYDRWFILWMTIKLISSIRISK